MFGSGGDHSRYGDRHPDRKHGTQKHGQPGDEQAQIVADGDQDGVDGIAGGAGKVVAFQQAIGLGMADDRLDGISSPQLAFDGGRGDAAGVGDVDLGFPAMFVAFVATIDIGPFDGDAGQTLNLCDLPGEGVAIVGVASA